MKDDLKNITDKLGEHDDKIREVRETLYGNKEKNLKGMNEKVDEIHVLLVQAKGLKGFMNLILLFAASITAIKVWFGGGH